MKGTIFMNNKNVKIIVTGLDGTLLKDDKTILNHSLNIINEFRKSGNLLLLQLHDLLEQQKNL